MAAPMLKIFFQLRSLHGFKSCCHGDKCISAFFVQHRSKHYNPKFKKERKEKFVKIEFPSYDKSTGKESKKKTPDELRMELKKQGHAPPRTFAPRPISISCTGGVEDKYVPPEGDGKSSVLSKAGTLNQIEQVKMKGKSLNAVRKIKKMEDNFDTKTFPSEALEIYKESQKCLEDVKKNKDRLHNLVTERAFPLMTFGLEYKSFRWNFIESVEPARVVLARVAQMVHKDNLYAQITVRFHTKQTLAVYDRFGRLMYGSENLVKDILEYVVFEKHISDEYGQWRVHEKIIPHWMPRREPLIKTYVKPDLPPLPESEPKKDVTVTKTESDSNQPQLATA